jgi:hypothetical protein
MSTIPKTLPYKSYKNVPRARGNIEITVEQASEILNALGTENSTVQDNFDSPFFLGSNNATLLRDVMGLIKAGSAPITYAIDPTSKASDWHVIPTSNAIVKVSGSDVYIVHMPDQDIRIHNTNAGSTPIRVHVGAPNAAGNGFNLHGTFVVPAFSTKQIGSR